jgi:hypothetical protein
MNQSLKAEMLRTHDIWVNTCQHPPKKTVMKSTYWCLVGNEGMIHNHSNPHSLGLAPVSVSDFIRIHSLRLAPVRKTVMKLNTWMMMMMMKFLPVQHHHSLLSTSKMGRMMIFWIPLDPGSGDIFEVGISFQGWKRPTGVATKISNSNLLLYQQIYQHRNRGFYGKVIHTW